MRFMGFSQLVAVLGAATSFSVAIAENGAPTNEHWKEAERRAASMVKQMTAAEKTILTHGIMPLPLGPKPPPIPADAIPAGGYIAGIPRLGIPTLRETDASLGVAYVFGLRKDGATVAQLYLVSRGGETKQRLVGYRRIQLEPGEVRQITLAIDPRLLADWRDGAWRIPAGEYRFALGDHAEALGPHTAMQMKARQWRH